MTDSIDPPRGESRRATAAFEDYAAMGPARSLDALHRRYVQEASTGRLPPTLKRNTLHKWSQVYGWVARAAAHDAEQRRLDAEAIAEARQESAKEMAERQTAQGRQLQAIARLLAERAEQYIRLLRVATVETIDEVGQVVRVVKTELSATEAANLLRAAAALAKVGIDVERLATGEATDRVDLRVVQREAEKAAKELGLDVASVMAEVEAMFR